MRWEGTATCPKAGRFRGTTGASVSFTSCIQIGIGALATRSIRLATEAQRNIHLEKTVFTCINQSCGTQWQLSDVVIKDEGQGPLFRCALCGARNYLKRVETKDGRVIYKQIEGKPLK
ncbi:hypothetical protein R77564_03442 [Ralstonia sp. LMG 32965]|uniref:Uncharacterized protein n=1 Tax=Ralstonia flatus TaxID=3058601 RepID=A0ABN9KE06_9RALS|nr:hypothetical protein R77564_03442 [Ralstonia sp. LMG 32965]